MKQLLNFTLLTGLLLSCGNTDFETQVRTAVDRQMETYPQSTLKDLYKNFFQDQFGPGHIIRDTAGAGTYLREELSSYTQIEGPIAEPTGYEGNFYRLNLSVIKTGQVAYPVYFDAFVRSVNGIRPPSVAEWKKEWEDIEAIIRSMRLHLPDYEADRKEIEEKLNQGEAQGDHSKRFEEHYSPHYRIIRKEIYEKEILPLIHSNTSL
ncbi:MAG: hypothetical protein LBB84_04305 [Tannerellaceae bacterium]|jgi:hypothetical protein|nr:hypothetical protein [Tannerellaceae bacterium]